MLGTSILALCVNLIMGYFLHNGPGGHLHHHHHGHAHEHAHEHSSH